MHEVLHMRLRCVKSSVGAMSFNRGSFSSTLSWVGPHELHAQWSERPQGSPMDTTTPEALIRVNNRHALRCDRAELRKELSCNEL